MPCYLGIDQSLTGTGLVRTVVDETAPLEGQPSFHIDVTTVKAPPPHKTDKSRRYMVQRVESLLSKIDAALEGVDKVGMEDLAYSGTLKGESAWVLPWIFGEIHRLAYHRGLPEILIVGTSQIKKYATGKGNADKELVLPVTIKRYPSANITNNNEADAMNVCAILSRFENHPFDRVPTLNQEVIHALRNPAAPAKRRPRNGRAVHH